MSALFQCIYASSASHLMSANELDQILAISRQNNRQRDVTGMLLYVEGSFFQVLEGERKVVEELFCKIGEDSRHTQVTRIISEAISHRNFPNWSMGYSSVTRAELASMLGRNEFGTANWTLEHIGNGRARKLLTAFTKGRWRHGIPQPTSQNTVRV